MSKTDELLDTIDSSVADARRRAAAGEITPASPPRSNSVRWFVVGIVIVSAALAAWYAFGS